jgi:D-alanyl-lipoteichoic acid acyltransferase DltB (MBOAT superfamily)
MTIPIVDQLDSIVGSLASYVGKPEDQIRLMLCIYMGYPLGIILNLLVKGTTARHLFSVITGFLLQLYMYREQFWHSLVMTSITYALMVALPRNKQARFVFIFVMLYLSYQHISRMIRNFGGYDMDVTTFTMVLTAKLSALAYCYKDGGEKDEKLLPEQKDKKVEKLPNVLELLSYVYFPSACIVGPFFEFADFKMYIEKTGRYANIPSSGKQALLGFLRAKLCLVIHMGIANYCYPAFCGTEEYAA